MNRIRVVSTAMAIVSIASSLHAQKPTSPCALKFSIATKDALGNIDEGLKGEDEKWLEKTLAKQYRGICYVHSAQGVTVLLLISISERGDEAVSAPSRTLGDPTGSSTTSTKTIYRPVYTLQLTRVLDGKPQVLRTFQRMKSTDGGGTGLPGLISGINASRNNPERDVILEAINWIADATIDLSTEAPKAP